MQLTGSESRVKDVDIDRDVDLRITDPRLELFDHALHTDTVDVSGFDGLEPAANIVPCVAFAAE